MSNGRWLAPEILALSMLIGVLCGMAWIHFGYDQPVIDGLQAQLDEQTIIARELQESSHYNVFIVYPLSTGQIQVYNVSRDYSIIHKGSMGNAEVISLYAKIDNSLILFHPGTIQLEKPIVVDGSNVILYAVLKWKTMFTPTPDFNNYTSR